MKWALGISARVPPPEAELFRQDDDAAAFRRLVGQRGELGGVRQLLDAYPLRRQELRRLPVASVIVPVLSRSRTFTSPAASTARPLIARTFF